jgi:hypothetical protein
MLSVEQRVKFVENNNLCRVCLGPGHPLADCNFSRKARGVHFAKMIILGVFIQHLASKLRGDMA